MQINLYRVTEFHMNLRLNCTPNVSTCYRLVTDCKWCVLLSCTKLGNRKVTIPSRSWYDCKCQQLSNCVVIDMRAASYCDVTPIDYSDTEYMDSFITTMTLSASGPFYWHGLTLIPAWITNYMPGKVWGEITYPFLNFNGCTVEV